MGSTFPTSIGSYNTKGVDNNITITNSLNVNMNSRSDSQSQSSSNLAASDSIVNEDFDSISINSVILNNDSNHTDNNDEKIKKLDILINKVHGLPKFNLNLNLNIKDNISNSNHNNHCTHNRDHNHNHNHNGEFNYNLILQSLRDSHKSSKLKRQQKKEQLKLKFKNHVNSKSNMVKKRINNINNKLNNNSINILNINPNNVNKLYGLSNNINRNINKNTNTNTNTNKNKNTNSNKNKNKNNDINMNDYNNNSNVSIDANDDKSNNTNTSVNGSSIFLPNVSKKFSESFIQPLFFLDKPWYFNAFSCFSICSPKGFKWIHSKSYISDSFNTNINMKNNKNMSILINNTNKRIHKSLINLSKNCHFHIKLANFFLHLWSKPLNPSNLHDLPPIQIIFSLFNYLINSIGSLNIMINKELINIFFDQNGNLNLSNFNYSDYLSLNSLIAISCSIKMEFLQEKLFSIVSIANHSKSLENEIILELKNLTIYKYSSVYNSMYYYNRISILGDGIKSVLALLLLFLLSELENYHQLSSIISVTLIRLSQELGLNRNLYYYGLSDSERESKKKLWWLCYLIDRYVSFKNGTPLIINEIDIGVDYPSSFNRVNQVNSFQNKDISNEERNRILLSMLNETPREFFTAYYLSICLFSTKLYKTFQTTKILKLSSITDVTYTIEILNTDLDNWRKSLPDKLQPFDITSSNYSITSSTSSMSSILFNQSLRAKQIINYYFKRNFREDSMNSTNGMNLIGGHIVLLHLLYYNFVLQIHRFSFGSKHWVNWVDEILAKGKDKEKMFLSSCFSTFYENRSCSSIKSMNSNNSSSCNDSEKKSIFGYVKAKEYSRLLSNKSGTNRCLIAAQLILVTISEIQSSYVPSLYLTHSPSFSAFIFLFAFCLETMGEDKKKDYLVLEIIELMIKSLKFFSCTQYLNYLRIIKFDLPFYCYNFKNISAASFVLSLLKVLVLSFQVKSNIEPSNNFEHYLNFKDKVDKDYFGKMESGVSSKGKDKECKYFESEKILKEVREFLKEIFLFEDNEDLINDLTDESVVFNEKKSVDGGGGDIGIEDYDEGEIEKLTSDHIFSKMREKFCERRMDKGNEVFSEKRVYKPFCHYVTSSIRSTSPKGSGSPPSTFSSVRDSKISISTGTINSFRNRSRISINDLLAEPLGISRTSSKTSLSSINSNGDSLLKKFGESEIFKMRSNNSQMSTSILSKMTKNLKISGDQSKEGRAKEEEEEEEEIDNHSKIFENSSFDCLQLFRLPNLLFFSENDKKNFSLLV
ncbi:fungal specific transcription factor domain-containing protein ASCRUDRAFT_86777 [Ascoidea rubescens DSM 1968]|uniref:Xylanolytic transcriptional activator regulatory domain-containing protein n=1 Tax=Ascoidea rubescens DSM 1968 TaxID=1344418 RepID=A0A1D2VGB5_9ASCO|nr:hypothetical protein ASCRUDRAFT_86777 [Ascoidea rubescens DSM 1968]ODV60543.1 hypothetical protein ASCRUDRAFT_86777 [Ascoidea rubescens DSM 1968]